MKYEIINGEGFMIDRNEKWKATEAEVQLVEAEKAYIMPLKYSKSRYGWNVSFAIYTQKGNEGLQVLWAKELNYENPKKSKLFYHQERTRSNSDLPAFVFRLGGCGYSKTNELAIFLHEYNPKMEVYVLNGYMPSLEQTYISLKNQ